MLSKNQMKRVAGEQSREPLLREDSIICDVLCQLCILMIDFSVNYHYNTFIIIIII